ncbi:MAG: SMI1/KNR4 family protein [Bacteroidota bacterium]
MDQVKINPPADQSPASERQVARLEELLGWPLPADYRRFLLRYNGGAPEPNVFRTQNKRYESDLRSFYGFYPQQKALDLIFGYDLLQDRLPRNSLAIASDSLGNFIFLQHPKNQIKFFDHEIERSYLIAHSFTALLDGLYRLEVESSALERAIDQQDLAYFDRLLRSGLDINALQDDYGQALPLMVVWRNKMRLLQYLIERGVNTAGLFVQAVARDRLEIVHYLYATVPVDLEERNPSANNSTPLMHASHNGNLALVRWLIEKGADPAALDDYGKTALDKARWGGQQEVMTYLEGL